MKIKKLKVVILVFSLWLLGCSFSFKGITYYDPTTYKNLTDLKPEVMALYETFTSDSIDTNKIAEIYLNFEKIYEYEKGKGEKNFETTKQIEIIKNMFKKHVDDRNKGKWNETHMENQKQLIGEAFDIAIETERLKNKNE